MRNNPEGTQQIDFEKLVWVSAMCDLEQWDHRGTGTQLFVAEINNIVIGWIGASIETFAGGLGAIVEGFVLDDRARIDDVGSRLLDAVEAWARELGCIRVRIQSFAVIEWAHALYELNGYARINSEYQLEKHL